MSEFKSISVRVDQVPASGHKGRARTPSAFDDDVVESYNDPNPETNGWKAVPFNGDAEVAKRIKAEVKRAADYMGAKTWGVEFRVGEFGSGKNAKPHIFYRVRDARPKSGRRNGTEAIVTPIAS